ncbi:succinyl-diaminopimelate desuccinylase [Salinibacterium sp. PAMC 21357]|uniref:succinyl-diaminopimelate desuccinylase n=1 Tax=Salinibacterium sp. PAMC 21357 TaxID=1112215 RepID=UPI00047468EA|nr:succinyl-diaminopimelate desuccinylase [Salinibacterium sp. PAMC 21357]
MPVTDPTVPVLDLSASSIDLTRQLCDIESVSGNEQRIADAVETALSAFSHLEVIRDANAVIARTSGGKVQRVVIAGHLDTVPVNANLPTTLEMIDGEEHLVGRGTVDMKGGVAVALKLAGELVDPAVDVTWIFYDLEEVAADLNGLGRIARNRPDLMAGDFAIIGEPSNSTIEGGCNGTARIDIQLTGLRAHSARAWMGENAIHAAAPVLAILAAYEPEQREVDGLVYREGLNAVGISGGVAGNVIPDAATVTVNFRFAPDRSTAQAIEHLREVFDGYEFEVTDLASGARPGLDAPIAQQFMKAVGGTPAPKYGWTDVARFSELGVPAVNYGPGNPLRAHADDERVATREIAACEQGLRAWLTAR